MLPTGHEGHTGQNGRVPLSLARGPLLILALALGTALAFAAPGVAAAHAYYVSSNPAANATLKAAPSTVTIHFAENVNPIGSDVVVYDMQGKVVSGTAQVDRADLKTMIVPMQGDGSEVYLVEWHTVSADDGAPDIGAFTFNISANSGTATPTANASAAPPGAGASSRSGSSGSPGWVVALVGVLGLVIGAGGALLVRRAR